MGKFRVVEVRTLGELVDRCTPAERDPESGRLRNYSVFRGVAGCELAGLLTSLDRLGGVNPPHTKGHLEAHIFRNFQRYARSHISQTAENEWEQLITAQHHGLPTRLLDWSYSPLVAAHFATLDGARENDRSVWRLDWKVVHQHFGLKPLAFLVSDLHEALKKKGYTCVWDLFEKEAEEQFICMLEPPALDSRISAQAAAFTFCSTKKKGLPQILEENGLSECLTQYVIPNGRVADLRDQLDLCTTDERRLFPDLDGVAAELRRYYEVSADPASG